MSLNLIPCSRPALTRGNGRLLLTFSPHLRRHTSSERGTTSYPTSRLRNIGALSNRHHLPTKHVRATTCSLLASHRASYSTKIDAAKDAGNTDGAVAPRPDNNQMIDISVQNENQDVADLIAYLSSNPSDNSNSEIPNGRTINKHVAVEVVADSWSPDKAAVKVTINYREKRNRLSSKLLTDLTTTFKAISTLSQISLVIFRGHDDQLHPDPVPFSSGADLNEMANINSPQEAESFIRKVSALCTAIRDCPAPVVALIDGQCFGAGLEIAASCDLRYASKRSTFAMPEVLLGIPSVVEARLLVDIIGWARTRMLLMTAPTIKADVACQWGLADKVPSEDRTTLPSKAVLNWERRLCQNVMSKVDLRAVRAQKKLMRQWETLSVDEGIDAGVKAFADMWSDEANPPSRLMLATLKKMAERKEQKMKQAEMKPQKNAATTEETGKESGNLRITRYPYHVVPKPSPTKKPT